MARTSRKGSSDALGEYLDGLMSHLRSLIPHAAKGDVEAIHQARVTTRRLKASVDLLKPVLTSNHKGVTKTLKKLRKRLGPLRDLDVMLSHVEPLTSGKHADAANWIDQRLRPTREKLIKKVVKDLGNISARKLGAWQKLRGEYAQNAEAIPTLLVQTIHAELEDFALRAGRIAELHANPGEQNDPHALRISGKSLRYTLEMAREAKFTVPVRVMKAFKRMQDALGFWHDHVVLTERIMLVAAEHELAHHDPVMQRNIFMLANSTLRKSEQQLQRFVTLWRADGENIRSALADKFPMTKDIAASQPVEEEPPPSESQTDPGPSDSPEPPAGDIGLQDEKPAA